MSSHGSRLQLPGFFGTEGAHQSQIASASASTNRHITPNGDRQTAVSQCANASTCGQTRVEESLGQTRYWGSGPMQRLPPTFVSSYLGPCLIRKRVWPASWRSKSCKQDSRSKGGVCEVGVDMSQGPSARLCLVAFLVEPRSALHARGRIRIHNTCESA